MLTAPHRVDGVTSTTGRHRLPAGDPRGRPRRHRGIPDRVMRLHRPRRERRVLAVLIVSSIVAAGLVLATNRVAEPDVHLRVDFNDMVVAAPRSSIGFTATTLNVDGGLVARNVRDATTLGRLGVGAVRIHLRSLGNGTVVSGAEGGAQEIPADRWLATYCGMGAQLTVVLDLNQDDALDVLKYLRSSNCRVHRFVLGNEMDGNSQSDVAAGEYLTRFHAIAKAMRAVDPTLEIGGPAPAYFQGITAELVDGLLQGAPDERASFIDYHAYGAGRGEVATMATSWRYADQLDQLRQMIHDPAVGLQVGEFNLSWAQDPKDNSQFQSVWVASALGTILSKGAVAFEYGDKTQASGLVDDGTPKASYWGMAAFTGAGQFRPFGATMVATTSDDPSVRVFASTGEKNVVVVNTGDARDATVALDGFTGGKATVWQSEAGQYGLAATTTVDAQLHLDLPGMSITTVVLDDRH